MFLPFFPMPIRHPIRGKGQLCGGADGKNRAAGVLQRGLPQWPFGQNMEGQVPGFCRDSPDSYNHCNPNLYIYVYIYSRIPRTFVINQGFEMF